MSGAPHDVKSIQVFKPVTLVAVVGMTWVLVQMCVRRPQHWQIRDVHHVGLACTHTTPRQSNMCLFLLLPCVPGAHPCRERILPLLCSLAAGSVDDDEVHAALGGITHAARHVRAAALHALPHVPCLAEGQAPEDDPHAACLLYIARYDPDEANAQVSQHGDVPSICAG